MSLSFDDFQRLRRYLPQPLVEALRLDPDAPAPSVLKPCLSHLVELLDTTTRHLPAYLFEQVMRDPTPGKANGQFITGTLLFADISGFTAMSESLSRVGREGAEEVTSIVNRYFGTMLGLMRDQAGQLIKFGGDALLALFPEPDSATRAAQTAVKMQAAMVEFAETKTSQGTFPLRMKVGIRKGRFFAAQLGTTDGMQYALFGHDVNATAAAESAAVAGQVVADRATHAAITVSTRTSPIPGHADAEAYLLIEDITPPRAPQPSPVPAISISPTVLTLENLQEAVTLLEALTPYLPTGLLSRISGFSRTTTMEGEHRLVAVLFANIRGLGDIADRLGPGHEDAIVTALNRYFVAMSKPIREFGGVINKIDLYDHGDKLLTFFGAPVAHEDDAERAVRAALGMQAALHDLHTALPAEAGVPDLTLTQQLGLSYNYVFAGYVGADWQHEYTVMGDEVNLSARLMSVAQPGDVTVSASVRRKVQALFDLEPRGAVMVKGKSAPIPIFVVKGPRAIPEESAQNLAGMRSPMVGREAEWGRLCDAVINWRAGQGQIISIIGEAGLGKSRLAAELRRSLMGDATDPTRWIEGRCLSYTETVSYYPMREMVRQLLEIQPADNEAEAWAKLRHAPIGATNQPYLANFINLPLDTEAQEKIQYLDAEALQKRTFIAIRSLIDACVRAEQRLVLALDDIHWMDEASAGLLEYLLPVVDSLPVLILLLYRPERDSACWRIRDRAAHDFAPGGRALEIELTRLTTADSAQLLTNLVTLDPWPDKLQNKVLERIEGNPLYLEELLRAFVDGGVLVRDEQGWRVGGDVEGIQLPDTLEGVMMTRLDRLEESYRHTTQVASVIGRRFPFEVLSNVVPEVDDASLNACLARVQQQEIVRESQRFPELVYMFRHGLMQEVSYGSLLARTRRVYHGKIAAYLESILEAGGEADAIPLIAYHAFIGHDWPMALRYQSLAGQRAQKLFANQNAIDHFTKALHCADNLPAEDPTVTAQRMTTLVALGELLTTMGQYDRALDYLTQARTLAETQNDFDAQARACRWLARLHELRGEYPPALEWIQHGLIALDGHETAEGAQMRLIAGLINVRQGNYDAAVEQCQQALLIAQNLHEITALARAYNLLGVVQLSRNGSMAIEYFQQALDLYQQAGDLQGQALAHNLIANAEFKTSHWPSADHHYRRARDLFDQIGDIYNRAIADSNLGGIALNQGRLDQALAFHQEALRSLEAIGGSLYLLGAVHNNLGATHIRLGAAEAARDHLRISREYFEKAQARDFLPELLRHLAEAALLAGDWAEADTQIEQALALARELSARGEEGNLLRVLGQTALAGQDWPRAEQALRESVEILDEVEEDYEGARSRLILAELYAASAQPEQALATLAQCEPLFERLEAALDLEAARAMRQKLTSVA